MIQTYAREDELKPCDFVKCTDFPCRDVQHSGYYVPDIEIDPLEISIVMISESSPVELKDHFYKSPPGLFAETTLLAFQEAGIPIKSIEDILAMGIYLTTAVKCAKTGYGIGSATIKTCSTLLEQELTPFEHVKAYLLMGDVAIKGFNAIAKRSTGRTVIPAEATYKIRKNVFEYDGARVYPSYLQAGASFFIEKGKHKVIAEDIQSALALPPYRG